jgi:hypothetical protein
MGKILNLRVTTQILVTAENYGQLYKPEQTVYQIVPSIMQGM